MGELKSTNKAKRLKGFEAIKAVILEEEVPPSPAAPHLLPLRS